MTEYKVAFFIWLACAVFFLVLGICSYRSKTPAGFWANAAAPKKVTDLKAYNHAVGRLWCGFAVAFAALGLPILFGQDIAIMFSVLGMGFAVIVMVIIYTFIELKYKIK